jgi:uncharacterized protein YaiI (UPF0178 family)
MRIWADADSLPRRARDLIARRATLEYARAPGADGGAGDAPHAGFKAIFVANRAIGVGQGKAVDFIQAPPGEGAADAIILAQARPGDLVVTRDIPLAERLLELHGDSIAVINDRGAAFKPDTVRERRSIRDAMLELSLSGLVERPRSNYGAAEASLFARAMDAGIARLRGAPKKSTKEGTGR